HPAVQPWLPALLAPFDAIFVACRDNRGNPMASRRELIKAIGAGVAALPTIGGAATLAQGTVSSPADAATEAFLAQFETAWCPLDPQLRFVLRLIYARL